MGALVPRVLLQGTCECVELMALMVQQAGEGLLQGPLSVAELHVACGWDGAELFVAEVGERAEGLSRGRQAFEQAPEVDVRRGVTK